MKMLRPYRRRAAARDAQEWLLRLERSDEKVRVEFDEWLMASAEHVEAILLVTAFNEELARRLTDAQPVPMATSAHPAAAAVVANAARTAAAPAATAAAGTAASAAVTATSRAETTPWERPPRIAVALTCTAVVIACGGIALWHQLTTKANTTAPPPPTVYMTSEGEQRTVDLPDGSTLNINSTTRVQVDFTNRRRQVQVESGEVRVDVQPDSQRPFEVTNACATMTALGTSFSVRAAPGALCDLAVTRGKVRVSAHTPTQSAVTRDVPAGQVAMIHPGAIVIRSLDAETLRKRLDWARGSLWFHGASVETVVTEFNRYNAVQLKMAAQSVGEVHIWGEIGPTDVGRLLEILRKSGITATPPDDRGFITLTRLQS